MHIESEEAAKSQTMLVLLAQAGDRAALEELLREAYGQLRRYVNYLVGTEFAEDVLQETSLQIFRKLKHLREPAVFRAWTFRIASRIAFAQMKSARRWSALEEAPVERMMFEERLGEGPDEGFLDMVERVSPASRAVLLLRYQQDLSLEETAAILEVPVGTVKSRLHYGVTMLRNYFNAERKRYEC
jgi:RNA polymerase sigma-70 factor (ECF subfamily)